MSTTALDPIGRDTGVAYAGKTELDERRTWARAYLWFVLALFAIGLIVGLTG